MKTQEKFQLKQSKFIWNINWLTVIVVIILIHVSQCHRDI